MCWYITLRFAQNVAAEGLDTYPEIDKYTCPDLLAERNQKDCRHIARSCSDVLFLSGSKATNERHRMTAAAPYVANIDVHLYKKIRSVKIKWNFNSQVERATTAHKNNKLSHICSNFLQCSCKHNICNKHNLRESQHHVGICAQSGLEYLTDFATEQTTGKFT